MPKHTNNKGKSEKKKPFPGAAPPFKKKSASKGGKSGHKNKGK